MNDGAYGPLVSGSPASLRGPLVNAPTDPLLFFYA